MELLIPIVEIDLVMVEKFRKLPNKAIPEVPKKTEIIFEENTPSTILIPIEMELIDNTFNKTLFLMALNIIFL
jgi:hypothetical protein